MDTSSYGIWAMIAFWASAIGGIVIGITWAKSRGSNPVSRDLLIKSLKARLESGEITQDEYDRKVTEIDAPRKP
jgi:putative membrane protein